MMDKFISRADLQSLPHKSVLITGGCGDIGAKLLTTLAAEGCSVVIGDLTDGTQLIETTKKKTGNQSLHYVHLDVTDFESQQRFFRKAAELVGGVINSVIVNAGVNKASENSFFERPPNYTEGPLDRPPPPTQNLQVNLIGAMNTTHLALSYLKIKGSDDSSSSPDRHILLVGSIAGIASLPLANQYGTSKFGVTGLFLSLRPLASERGYRINLVCPYFIDTPILGRDVKLLMAGGPLADATDVSNLITKAVAEDHFQSRLFVVTRPAKVADARAAGLQVPDATDDQEVRAWWEGFRPEDGIGETYAHRIITLIKWQGSKMGYTAMFMGMLKALWWSYWQSWTRGGTGNAKPGSGSGSGSVGNGKLKTK